MVRTLGKTIEKRSGKQGIRQRFREAGKQSTNIIFSWHSPLVILWENAWKMQRSRARDNYRKTFKKTGYSLAFSWCKVTCDELRVFLSFIESEQLIFHPFSDIRKRQCNVEFFSLSPFRKINGERVFLCRDLI